jgi:diaminohydroxyphosphoribosylaminopyrimidine deaminase/5-amino-6-(5-phosphoribosylamino)uracil reductase
VDAILTGIGTVLKDDPLLTARDVRIRRLAHRVIIDPKLETPPTSRLVASARQTPTIIVCDSAHLQQSAHRQRLTDAGVQFIACESKQGEIPLDDVLRILVQQLQVSTVLVEAGVGVMSRLLREKLVNEVWAFIAPIMLGDEAALPIQTGTEAAAIVEGTILQLEHLQRRRGDIIARYRVS